MLPLFFGCSTFEQHYSVSQELGCLENCTWVTKKLQIIIRIIAFKGAIRDFLQSPHSAANCLQHAHSSGPGAIVCKSRATHRALITCNMSCYVLATWYEGTAQLLSLTELKSHLFELYFIGWSNLLSHPVTVHWHRATIPGTTDCKSVPSTGPATQSGWHGNQQSTKDYVMGMTLAPRRKRESNRI